MTITVAGPAAPPTILAAVAPVVYLKHIWGGTWQPYPEIHVLRGSASVASQGIGSMELMREYGANVKAPHESALAARTPIDLLDWWVRVDMMGEYGAEVSWIGQISSEARDVYGDASVPTGKQTWVAYEPLQWLERLTINQSIWYRSEVATTQVLDWVPSMNVHDERNLVAGNRTASAYSGQYYHGPEQDTFAPALWTRLQYANYLLANFVDQGDDSGPEWRMAGQTDILSGMTDVIAFDESETVASMLRKLIPRSLGIDFLIRPIQMSPIPGFEVYVYALGLDEYSFGTATLPRNPTRVSFAMSQSKQVDRVRVVRTLDHQYDRINVIGGPIVVCCTLRAADGSLVPKWTSTLEASYQLGAGTDRTPAENDKARTADYFRPVYQQFGAPADWDFLSGQAAPLANYLGTIAGSDAPRQTFVRNTLRGLPLFENYDYTSHPPTNLNPGGYTADRLPPQAWVVDPDRAEGAYSPVDTLGFSVHAATNDYGLLITGTPNHLLALGDWPDTAQSTDTAPKYAYTSLVVTIAFELDQRLCLTYELLSGTSDIARTLTIQVPEAELWYLVSGTVVGCDANGNLLTSGMGRELRNDSARLATVMTGAIARYNLERTRATVSLHGLWSWTGVLGQILDVIEQGGTSQSVKAPICSVEWSAGDGRQPRSSTIIRTGYAI